MIARDAEEVHGRARLADARVADAEVVGRGRTERFVHQARGEAVAIAGGQEDDVDVRAVRQRIDGIAAGADRLIVDMRRDDEDAVLPRGRMQARILLNFRVVGTGRIEQ